MFREKEISVGMCEDLQVDLFEDLIKDIINKLFEFLKFLQFASNLMHPSLILFIEI